MVVCPLPVLGGCVALLGSLSPPLACCPVGGNTLPVYLSLGSVLLPCAGVLARCSVRDHRAISFPSLSKAFLIYISVVSPNYHPFGLLVPPQAAFPCLWSPEDVGLKLYQTYITSNS